MLTKQQVLDAVMAGKESRCIDGRDYKRLVEFFNVNEMKHFGYTIQDDAEVEYIPKPWTAADIIAQLQDDVAFGFEKALDRRGISSGLMYETVKMWLWILEDPLQSHDDYPMYGLQLFKAVAVKYGFENPIGDDTGSESKYNEEEDD